MPVVEGLTRSVGFNGGAGSANYSVSSTGGPIFVPNTQALSTGQREILRIDRKGGVERVPLPESDYRSLRISPTSDRWCSTRTQAKRRPSGSTACPARARRDGSPSWATTGLPSGQSMASEWCSNRIATVTSACTGNALTARARRSGSRSRTRGRLTSRIHGRHLGIDPRSVRWPVPSARCGTWRFWTESGAVRGRTIDLAAQRRVLARWAMDGLHTAHWRLPTSSRADSSHRIQVSDQHAKRPSPHLDA